MSIKYYIDTKVYRTNARERYVRVGGWALDTDGLEITFKVLLNDREADYSVNRVARADVYRKYSRYSIRGKVGFYLTVPLETEEPESVSIFACNGKTEICMVYLKKKELNKIRDCSMIAYHIDKIEKKKSKLVMEGWASSSNGNHSLGYGILSENGEQIRLNVTKSARPDLVEIGLVSENDKNCGFRLEFEGDEAHKYLFEISDQGKKKKILIDVKNVLKKQELKAKVGFVHASMRYMRPRYAKKLAVYVQRNGVKHLKEYIVRKVNSTEIPYQEWYEEHRASEQELTKQRNTVFPYCPLISIIVPVYRTPLPYLREMIDSVIAQTYGKWELCIADGSEGDTAVEAELAKYAASDKRIKFTVLEKNLGIAGNTNCAMKLATGEYIGLFDHDDILAPDALYELVSSMQQETYDILYTDEDKISADTKEHMDPNFKPDFSMDLFRSHNYITHFFVVKKEIADKVGGFRSEYDGSQDYDFMFRCIENSDKIRHIPMILYHWRIHMNSVAGDPASKMYAYEAGKRAIEDHLKRMNVDAEVEHVGLWGMYHVKYAVSSNPLVSVIIPNKDHIRDLDKCILSLLTKSVYQNFEIIIVENNSEKKETFAYYEHIQKICSKVRVITWNDTFNYAAINNYGVKYAKGEYLLFLNNDTEMISEDAIKEMLGHCMRKEVGAVGAKLLYADDTVQHAGVVIGFGNYAGHVNTGIGRNDYGYMVRARINCNYSAVTAACMMTKKSLFREVGGFDEQFVVACNDIDYCLKIRSIGKLIVFNAFSEWYHYESKSRGYEDTDEKIKRFEGEIRRFQRKWQDVLDAGDPYYNKNFPLNQPPFTLG